MAEASETTPLLSDPPAAPSGPSVENEQNVGSSPEPTVEVPTLFLRTTFLLTWLSIAFSILALGFNVAVVTLDNNSPYGYYMGWDITESCRAVLVLSVLAAFISFLNLVRLYRSRRAMWLWLNLILDALITFYSFALCIQGLSANFNPYNTRCSPPSWDPNPPDYDVPTCKAFETKIEILVGIGLGFGLALAIVHLILFLMRCVLAYRSRFWQGNGTWRFPTGQFTIEFTVKLLRQEEGTVLRAEQAQ